MGQVERRKEDSVNFYWLVVLEKVIPVVSEDGQTQFITNKWTRSGEIGIAPGQPTEDVVKAIVSTVKENDPEVPADSLLVNVTILPAELVPR